MNPQQPTQLDPQIMALTKAIRQVESGGDFNARGKSGEFGAYQYTPDTWAARSAKYGINVPIQKATPEQQNEVTYKWVAEKKAAGYNVGQIASMHNAGEGAPDAYLGGHKGVNKFGAQYDVPGYAQKVASAYHQFNQTPGMDVAHIFGVPSAEASTGQPQAPQQGGALFPSAPGDTGLQAGLKAAGNTIPDALQFGKGILQQSNPIQAADNIGQIASGFQDFAQKEGAGKALWDIIKGLPKAAYETAVPLGFRQLFGGDLEGASKTLTEHPFSTVAPAVFAAEGAAKLADRLSGAPTQEIPINQIKDAQGTTLDEVRGEASMTKHGLESFKAQGVEPAPDAFHGARIGRQVTEPIKAVQNADGSFSILDGNHRLRQAVMNGSETIPAKIEGTRSTAYSDAFNKGVETIASPVTKTAGTLARAPLTLGRSIVSHLTGLNPETISAVISDPKSFTKLQQESMNRASVAEDFSNALDDLESQKIQTGSEYAPIRGKTEPVPVSTSFIDDTLTKKGFEIKDGEISATTKSLTRNSADIKAVQNFYDNWGNKTSLTPEEFLNMRSDLQELSKFDKLTGMGKTRAAETLGKELYAKANETIRPQIEGLKELDERAAPQIQLYKQAKKDFLNPDGTLKDGAPAKIANSLNKNGLLSRMEQIRPGITKSIQVLKAVEDIQRANGIKVGNYTRAVLEGGGLLSGNIPVIIASILTHPSIAIQIIRGYGLTGKAVVPIVGTLQLLTGQVGPAVKVGSFNSNNSQQ